MTNFNTQTLGPDGLYRLSFETDNEEYYRFMQDMARMCLDFEEKYSTWKREVEE